MAAAAAASMTKAQNKIIQLCLGIKFIMIMIIMNNKYNGLYIIVIYIFLN
jgi:hypothetical protein